MTDRDAGERSDPRGPSRRERKDVDQNFEGKVLGEKTIAKYYQHYAGVEDKNVIYVYVSPKEVKPPSYITFCQALTRHETRSHQSIPQYLYGFCIDQGFIESLELSLPQ